MSPQRSDGPDAAERRCLGNSAASSNAARVATHRRSRRPYGEQTPRDPDPAPSIQFLQKTQKAADPVHYADVSLAVIKLMGPGEYAVSTPATRVRIQSHFALAAHDYTHSTAPQPPLAIP